VSINWGNTKPIAEQKSAVENWIRWAKTHQETLAVIGIVIILISIGIPYYFHSQEQSEKDAMAALSVGQYYLQSQVDPKKGSFKSSDEKNQEALKTFHRITTDYAGTNTAKVAKFYEAKCQFLLGQYPQAYASFENASRELKNTPLADQAFLDKVLCLETQGQWEQAIARYVSFLIENPNSFIAPEVHFHLAEDYLQMKNKPKAIEELKTTAKKYPDTSWGANAAWNLSLLDSNT